MDEKDTLLAKQQSLIKELYSYNNRYQKGLLGDLSDGSSGVVKVSASAETKMPANQTSWTPRQKLFMRMEWLGHPYKDLYFSKNGAGDKVLLFIVTQTGHIVAEDDSTMFPSDALIHKLRLLEP